ncbi:MAG: hypothetical protein M3R24_36850 [Chloroflexota bacterium]|nr:hypothetical protein [Chloroflexota bacterium]
MHDHTVRRTTGRPRQPAAVWINYNLMLFNQAAYALLDQPSKVFVDFDVATHQISVTPANAAPDAVTIKLRGQRTAYISAAHLTSLLRVYGLPAIRPQHYAVHLDGETMVLTPPKPVTLRWRDHD